MKPKILYFLIALNFIGCQKEIDGGLSTISNDYQPVSINSVWYYSSTSAGNYTLKSIGTDSIINGRSFYRFDQKTLVRSTRNYICKRNGVYRQYGSFAPAGGLSLELVYLKDTTIGTSWTNTVMIGGFNNYHKYTVAAKGLKKTVNGTVYKDVLELNYEFSIDDPLSGDILSAGGGKQFYARNIGQIESYFNVGILGFNSSDTTRLTNYFIR